MTPRITVGLPGTIGAVVGTLIGGFTLVSLWRAGLRWIGSNGALTPLILEHTPGLGAHAEISCLRELKQIQAEGGDVPGYGVAGHHTNPLLWAETSRSDRVALGLGLGTVSEVVVAATEGAVLIAGIPKERLHCHSAVHPG